MSNFSADEVRARLLAQKERQGGNNEGGQRKSRSTGDKALFPFWDAALGTTVTLRFLPDADLENPFFWRERQVIKLPFNGIVGGDYPTTKLVEVTVPCMNMFGKRCPINDYTKPWWKGTEQEKALAKRYWKKKTNLFQGFVVKSPFEEAEAPENPIRRFTISPQLFKLIQDSLLSPDMAEMPDHFDGGRDFNVKKTKQGEYSNYSTSGWSLNGPRSLSQAERDAIDEFGLHDLKMSLGAEPDAERLAVIEAMFHSSLNGDPFDVASFGEHFRAYSNERGERPADGDAISSVTPTRATTVNIPHVAPAATVAPVLETVQAEAPAPSPVAEAPRSKPTPQEILAAIAAKQKRA